MRFRIIFFLVFTLFIWQKVHCQTREIDSLNSLINQNQNDLTYADLYYQLTEYYAPLNLDTMIYFCNKSIAITDKNLKQRIKQ